MTLMPAVSRFITKAQHGLSVVFGGGYGNLYGGGWYGIIRESFGGAWQGNVTIDGYRDLLSFSGIWAPLTLIAADIAKCGIRLVSEDEKGIESDVPRTSPFWQMLRKPNHFQNWIQFIEQWILSKLLHGNMYALKVRDQRGIVVKLYILDPRRVIPLVAESGDVFYQLSTDHIAGLGDGETVPAREIIHDRWNCLWHPLVGIPPLYAAALSATMGRGIQHNSAKFFRNMSRPSGMLTSPGSLSTPTIQELKDNWERNYGGENIGKTAVLGDGLKYEAMGIPAEQSQLIEQLGWTARDIAACFHVPLFKVGGPVPAGSTIEALQLMYYTDCLQSLIEAAEACLDDGLGLPSNYYTEFDVDNLLRMDSVARMTSLAEGTKAGIYAPNEARAKWNLPPVAGGDSPYLQQQNFSLEALAKRDALPNPFVIDRPATNPTPSVTGPAVTADPAAKAAAETAALLAELTKGLEYV